MNANTIMNSFPLNICKYKYQIYQNTLYILLILHSKIHTKPQLSSGWQKKVGKVGKFEGTLKLELGKGIGLEIGLLRFVMGRLFLLTAFPNCMTMYVLKSISFYNIFCK